LGIGKLFLSVRRHFHPNRRGSLSSDLSADVILGWPDRMASIWAILDFIGGAVFDISRLANIKRPAGIARQKVSLADCDNSSGTDWAASLHACSAKKSPRGEEDLRRWNNLF
jgi:hypothetical protein